MSVGSPLPHDAAALHVSGAARYTDDFPLPAGTANLSGFDADIESCQRDEDASHLHHAL